MVARLALLLRSVSHREGDWSEWDLRAGGSSVVSPSVMCHNGCQGAGPLSTLCHALTPLTGVYCSTCHGL